MKSIITKKQFKKIHKAFLKWLNPKKIDMSKII